MIFQVVFTLFFGDTKASPFTVEITQLAHGNCWSKYLITFFNRLRLCTCYTSMERIDTSLTQRIITEAERHRVPVSSQKLPVIPSMALWIIEIMLVVMISHLIRAFRAWPGERLQMNIWNGYFYDTILLKMKQTKQKLKRYLHSAL